MKPIINKAVLMSLLLLFFQPVVASYSTRTQQTKLLATPSWSDILLKAEAYYHASEEQKQQTIKKLRQIIIQGDSENVLQAMVLLQEFRSDMASDYPEISDNMLSEAHGSFGWALFLQGRKEEAIDVLIKEAYLFDSAAQIMLNLLFDDYVDSQPEVARKIRAHYEKSAAEGAPRDLLMLGKIYVHGWGVTPNPEKALQLFKSSGLDEAVFNVGVMYANGMGTPKDIPKAMKWYERAAVEEYDLAQFNLGYLYFFGEEGLVIDYKQSFYWFEKAANNDFAQAMYYLGYQYEKGLGTDQDLNGAVYWYMNAARLDIIPAQLALAKMYYRGSGVEKNFIEALKWFEQAAQQGNEEAKDYLIDVHYRVGLFMIAGYKVKKDISKGLSLLTQSAEAGNVDAQYWLGQLYEGEYGVLQDLKGSQHWYEKAAAQGHVKAQQRLNERAPSSQQMAN